MSTAVALRMTSADILKLRKKRSILIWALVLVLAPLAIYFIVKVAQHSSTPAEHGPAGGIEGFKDGLRILGMLFGPLAAILIGVEAGAEMRPPACSATSWSPAARASRCLPRACLRRWR